MNNTYTYFKVIISTARRHIIIWAHIISSNKICWRAKEHLFEYDKIVVPCITTKQVNHRPSQPSQRTAITQ